MQATHRKFLQKKVFFPQNTRKNNAKISGGGGSAPCSSTKPRLLISSISANYAVISQNMATRISKPASQEEQGGKERNRNASWLMDTKEIKSQGNMTQGALLPDPGAVGHAGTVTAPTLPVTHQERCADPSPPPCGFGDPSPT